MWYQKPVRTYPSLPQYHIVSAEILLCGSWKGLRVNHPECWDRLQYRCQLQLARNPHVAHNRQSQQMGNLGEFEEFFEAVDIDGCDNLEEVRIFGNNFSSDRGFEFMSEWRRNQRCMKSPVGSTW